jgi:hypothetical protein
MGWGIVAGAVDGCFIECDIIVCGIACDHIVELDVVAREMVDDTSTDTDCNGIAHDGSMVSTVFLTYHYHRDTTISSDLSVSSGE